VRNVNVEGSRVRETRKHGSERGGVRRKHGRDHVAPPGNQAANREHKLRSTLPKDTVYSPPIPVPLPSTSVGALTLGGTQ
jgi:hypothetical protein